MLIGISGLITPDIYRVMYQAGHLDELVIADANYSAFAMGNNVVYSETNRNDFLLSEILKYFPVDDDRDNPIKVMSLEDSIYEELPLMWDIFQVALNESAINKIDIYPINRSDFYRETLNAYAVIKTCDCRPHSTLIIRKGMVLECDRS